MKSLLPLLFALTLFTARAQQGRFGGIVSAGTAVAFDRPSVTPFTFQAAGYYNAGKRFSAGLGTGVFCYEKTLIPLYGDLRFLLTRPRKFTPLLACSAGYAFAPARDTHGGLYLNPQFGVQYALQGNLRLLLGIGYEAQRLERLKTLTGEYLQAAYIEQLRHNSLSIKVGLLF